MLTLDQITIQQGDFHLAADWALRAGHKVAVVGPSGGGKSTLINAIAGFVQPASGRILWHGDDLADVAPGERPVSILFQDNNLFPHLTVFQNVALGLNPSLRLSRAEQAQVLAALRNVGIEDLTGRKPATLSGGQQSRVALARVLLRQKPLLLLDEPFAALGPALKVEMLDLVASLANANQMSVVMVSHDPADAKRFADQVVVLADGVAAAPVDTATVFTRPSAALKKYLGAEYSQT